MFCFGFDLVYQALVPSQVSPAPTVSATSEQTSLTLSWTAPVANNGAAITGYQILVRTGTSASFIVLIDNTNSTATIAIVADFLPGIQYSFKVAAINAIGTGPASDASVNVTIAGTCNPYSFWVLCLHCLSFFEQDVQLYLV